MPEGMTWEEAVDCLTAGFVVARESWDEGEIISLVGDDIRVGRIPVTVQDWLASDWITVGTLH